MLDAAARIVERSGAAHLTMDAVAAEAGVSKGGVLYHFPSKRALLAGMLDRLLARFEERFQAAKRKGESPLHAWIESDYAESPAERALALALLANAAEDPTLLDPARAFARTSFDEMKAAGPDPALNLVLMLATEGLRLLDLFGLLSLTSEERDRVYQRMLRLDSETRS